MNKQRRKAISVEMIYISGKIEALQAAIDFNQLVDLEFAIDACAVEGLRDEEQEAFDGLPESLQGGERGDQMQEAIQYLDDAISGIEEASGLIDSSREPDESETAQEKYVQAIEILEAAYESLDNAAA